MVLACLRRRAWLLVVVLVTGLASPVFAANSPYALATGAARHGAIYVHVHADGSEHAHAAPASHDHASATPDGSAERPRHCPGCPTDAACAISCLGVAVLPASVEWLPVVLAATWSTVPVYALRGVAPPGDIDPPRPVPFR